jgi:Transcription factor WhiB
VAITNGEYDPRWQSRSSCALPENEKLVPYFFSANPEKKAAAKNLCFSCDVRKECVKDALESKTIWGIWGGKDDNELRRTLSVNSEGNEIRRGRYPQCPYCSARTSRLRVEIVDLPDGGRWTTAKEVHCNTCGFSWRSRTSANAVDAYFTERADKAAKRARKRELAQRQPTRGGRSLRQSPE